METKYFFEELQLPEFGEGALFYGEAVLVVETQCKIANRLRVSPQTVSAIHSGRSWAWLSEEVTQ